MTLSRDPISKFWDPPYNFWTIRAIRFKFGSDIEDGPLLRVDHKTTPKWAWPRSRDPISKFWDSLITGKASKVNYKYINNNKTANIKDIYHTTKTAKNKKVIITLHNIDILAMCCRVISPSFLFLQF